MATIQRWRVTVTCLIVGWALAATARGDDFWKIMLPVTAPAKAMHREKPEAVKDPPVEQLANQIDWLEHYIDEFGTIVAKQPDVWGQSRLTQHREEYERVMAAELNNFAVTYQGSLARTDQAYLGFSMALQAAAAKAPPKPGVLSRVRSGNIGSTPTGGSFNLNTTITTPPSGSSGGSSNGTSNTSNVTPPPFAFGAPSFTPPFGLNSQAQMAGLGFNPATISLEPKMMLDELSNYLEHLHELRRINEGSDTNDSPGYALDLVRVPVSVFPGKKTRRGYGAEITVTATPYLTPELLPATFESLVTNDLIDLLAPSITQWVNDPEISDSALKLLAAEGKAREDSLAYEIEKSNRDKFAQAAETMNDIAKQIGTEHRTVLSLHLNKIPDDLLGQSQATLDSFSDNDLKAFLNQKASEHAKTVDRKASRVSSLSDIFSRSKDDAVKKSTDFSIKLMKRSALTSVASAPGTKSRRAYMPIPPSQIGDVLGEQMLARLIFETVRSLRPDPLDQKVIQLSDVRDFLSEETHAAYLFLGRDLPCEVGIRLEQPTDSDWGLEASNANRRKSVRPPRALAAARPAAPGPRPRGVVAVSNTEEESSADMPLAEEAPAPRPGILPPPVLPCDPEKYLSPKMTANLWRVVWCPALAQAVRGRRLHDVYTMRNNYLLEVGADPNNYPDCQCKERPLNALPPETSASSKRELARLVPPLDDDVYPVCKTLTAALGWGLLVESALLNEQLNDDYRESLVASGSGFPTDQRFEFYGPNPPPGARQAFVDYVRCRWPIRIFALDPAVDQQNIEDAYSRRRELQIALAMGFASGTIGAQGLLQASRKLESDMATIALNQTAIGFSHADDTFGWRFYPRFQTPPNKGNAVALWETIAGGPTTDQDMRERELEPMQRECVAIVVMPSFVPYVTFESRTRFFRLTDPKCTEISMRQTMLLSRSIKAMQQSAAQCSAGAGMYRDGDVAQLLNRVHQLDETLPLQSMRVQLPFENTSGGFELFNRGVTDLAPELVGWYGAPGIDSRVPTTLFLMGKGFSVNGMQLIAGGRGSSFNMLSRQVLQAVIPPGAPYVVDRSGNRLVEVQVATAYGVSNPMLVPMAPAPVNPPGAISDLAFAPQQSVDLYYTMTTGTSANAFKFANYQSQYPYIEITLPQATPALVPTLNATLYFTDANGGVTGTQSNVTFVYSSSTRKYGTALDPLLLTGKTPQSMGDLALSYLTANYGSSAPPAGPAICHITAVLPGSGSTPVTTVTGSVEVNLKKQ